MLKDINIYRPKPLKVVYNITQHCESYQYKSLVNPDVCADKHCVGQFRHTRSILFHGSIKYVPHKNRGTTGFAALNLAFSQRKTDLNKASLQ